MKNQIFRSLHATVNLFHAARNLQAKRRGKHGKRGRKRSRHRKVSQPRFCNAWLKLSRKIAQAIAKSIIRGAMKGNAEMVKIALALTGETPNTKIQINSGQLAELIDGLKEPVTDGIHAEAAGVNGAMADE